MNFLSILSITSLFLAVTVVNSSPVPSPAVEEVNPIIEFGLGFNNRGQGKVVELERRSMQIYIMFSEVQAFGLTAEPSTSVKSLRQGMAEKRKVAADKVSLKFEGTELQDKKTLGDYGIEDQDVLQMVVKK